MGTRRIALAFLACILFFTSVDSIKIRVSPPEGNQRLLTEKESQALSNVKIMIDGNGQYIYPEQNNIIAMYLR